MIVMIDLAAMIVAPPAAASVSGANPMSPVGLASIIAGALIFLALGIMVAHAIYRRKKEHDWHVAEWQRSEQAQRQQRDRRDEKLVH